MLKHRGRAKKKKKEKEKKDHCKSNPEIVPPKFPKKINLSLSNSLSPAPSRFISLCHFHLGLPLFPRCKDRSPGPLSSVSPAALVTVATSQARTPLSFYFRSDILVVPSVIHILSWLCLFISGFRVVSDFDE
jgi:hypothetical protein